MNKSIVVRAAGMVVKRDIEFTPVLISLTTPESRQGFLNEMEALCLKGGGWYDRFGQLGREISVLSDMLIAPYNYDSGVAFEFKIDSAEAAQDWIAFTTRAAPGSLLATVHPLLQYSLGQEPVN